LWALVPWVPITWRGAVALPLLALVYYAFAERKDQVVRSLTLSGLGLAAMMLVLVIGTSVWLRLRRQPSAAVPLGLEANVPLRTGYSLGHAAWNPLVKIDLAWQRPAGVAVQVVPAGGRFLEQVTASRRGVGAEIVRCFRVTDILGLTRFTVRRRAAQEVLIRPYRGPARRLPPLVQYVAGEQREHPEGRREGDLIEMRSYLPGDPLKLVLWKVYARTGRMLVRMPERAVRPCEKMLIYFVASPGDEAAAGIARAMLEGTEPGQNYLFAADGADSPTRSSREALDQLVRSAGAWSCGGLGLERFLGRCETAGAAACLLFVPSEPGPWLGRVAEQLARHRGSCRAIVGIDGFQLPPEDWSLRQLLVSRPASAGARPVDVSQVCQVLSRCGAEVWVIDRASGRSYRPTDLPAISVPRNGTSRIRT
jgi:hypothetical protein